MVRLDRAVADPAWSFLFPDAEVENITSATSDHGPIVMSLLVGVDDRRASKSFKYELMWGRHPELPTFIESEWGRLDASSFVQEVQTKLRSLGENLSSWDRNTFGHVKGEIKRLKRELKVLISVP